MEEKKAIDSEQLLQALEEVAAKIGVKVRYENLVGGPIRTFGGACRIRGEDVVFVDRNLPTIEKLYALGRELQNFDLENVYVAPAARKFLQSERAE